MPPQWKPIPPVPPHDDGELRWLGALICLASAVLMVALMVAVWRLFS